jgi:HK97 gp10 family phage protein
VLYANADHAAHVEFGTVHQSAQSFMRAAIDTRKDEAMRITAEEAEFIMEKAIR